MGVIRKARIMDFSSAEEEKYNYFKNLSPEERLRHLEHLRELNFGPGIKEPVKRILKLLPA